MERDNFMSAHEAHKFGLIDKILTKREHTAAEGDKQPAV